MRRNCLELQKNLICRGYPKRLVKLNIKKAIQPASNRLAPVFQIVTAVFDYHSDLKPIPSIVNRHLNLLHDDGVAIKFFWKPPPKISDILVRSRFPSTHPPMNVMIREGRTQKCNRARCKTCQWVHNCTYITSGKTNLNYPIKIAASCATENIVYRKVLY